MDFIEHTGSSFDDSAPGEEDLINHFKFIRTKEKNGFILNVGPI